MFGFGSFSHILVILVLALVLIGPKQLPEVARTLGRFLSELRRASNMFQDQFNSQMRDFENHNTIQPPQAPHHQEISGQMHSNHHSNPYHSAETGPSSDHEQQLELKPLHAESVEPVSPTNDSGSEKSIAASADTDSSGPKKS